MADARLIDGRGMVPPEPLELALAALPSLGPDEELTMLLYCHPVPLFNILRTEGFSWREEVADDGTHAIHIRRAGAATAG